MLYKSNNMRDPLIDEVTEENDYDEEREKVNKEGNKATFRKNVSNVISVLCRVTL